MRRLWNKGVFILTNCGVIHNAYKFRVGFAAALFVFLTSLRHLNILPNKFFYLAQYMAPALYVNFVVELYGKDRATISHALIVVTFCVPCIMCFFRKIESLPYLGAVTTLLGMYGFVLFPEIHPGVVMCATAYPLLWCIEIVHERRSRVSLNNALQYADIGFMRTTTLENGLIITEVNEALCSMMGYSKTEMVHKMSAFSIFGSSVNEMQGPLLGTASVLPYKSVLSTKRKDGTVFKNRISLAKYGQGFVATMVDVTKELDAQEENARYASIVENHPGICTIRVCSRMFTIEFASKLTEETLGYETLVGASLSDVTNCTALLSTSTARTRWKTKTGQLLWAKSFTASMPNGKILIQFVSVDKELKLQQEKNDLFRVVNCNPNIISFTMTNAQKVMWVSDSFCKKLGYTKSQIVGSSFTQTMHGDDVEKFKRAVKEFELIGKHKDVIFRFLTSTGGCSLFRGYIARLGATYLIHCVSADHLRLIEGRSRK